MSTHAGKEIYFSGGLGVADLADKAAFEGLTWTRVNGIGEPFLEYGPNQDISDFPTFSKVEKGLGTPDYGGGDIEVMRISGDAGQAAMKAQGGKSSHGAFKIVLKDSTGTETGDYTATTDYVKGVLTTPRRNAGQGGDMILDIYGFGATQTISVEPAVIA